MSRHAIERSPLGFAALVLVDAGGAVPFGISNLETGSPPNAAEWALSIMFAVVVIVIVASVATRRYAILGEAAWVSGAFWTATAFYLAVNGELGWKARLGLGLIFAGIAAGCFALWRRLHADEGDP